MMNCDNAAAILTRLIEVTGTSQRKLAEKLGWSPQLLNSRLKKNTFPANDWIAAVRALGYQVTPHPDCIHIEHPRVDGICPDFKKTVDGVLYEKATASARGHQWFNGGLRELYHDLYGHTYIATLICWPTLKLTIQPVTDREAEDFLAEKSTVKR